jgi:hypothetical protein
MIHPIRTPHSARAYRAPASSASVITASGIPASWNAYGPNWNSGSSRAVAGTPRSGCRRASPSTVSIGAEPTM